MPMSLLSECPIISLLSSMALESKNYTVSPRSLASCSRLTSISVYAHHRSCGFDEKKMTMTNTRCCHKGERTKILPPLYRLLSNPGNPSIENTTLADGCVIDLDAITRARSDSAKAPFVLLTLWTTSSSAFPSSPSIANGLGIRCSNFD